MTRNYTWLERILMSFVINCWDLWLQEQNEGGGLERLNGYNDYFLINETLMYFMAKRGKKTSCNWWKSWGCCKILKICNLTIWKVDSTGDVCHAAWPLTGTTVSVLAILMLQPLYCSPFKQLTMLVVLPWNCSVSHTPFKFVWACFNVLFNLLGFTGNCYYSAV